MSSSGSKPKVPQAAEPKHVGRAFDPWNSVSAGHQRPEVRVPTGWRESRNMKLQSQYRAGHAGGKRLSDLVGHGSSDFDERSGMLVPKEVRARAMNSVADMLRNPGTMRPAKKEVSGSRTSRTSEISSPSVVVVGEQRVTETRSADGDQSPDAVERVQKDDGHEQKNQEQEQPLGEQKEEERQRNQRNIFDGLCIYVNGSTHPLISDHKLKRLLAEHGARMSIHLGRRQVTHVILGKPSGPTGGAGGGLAGGKLEKEIRRVGGSAVKYVGVEWVLESVKAGKRLPEARFSNLKVALKGQQSVFGTFSK